MMVFAWLFAIILFVSSCFLLAYLLHQNPSARESLRTLVQGFKQAWRQPGLVPPRRRYPVELYIWDICEECEDCEECQERASWEPMDIADWMAEGLPGTPEAAVDCDHECHCQLSLYQPSKPQHPFMG